MDTHSDVYIFMLSDEIMIIYNMIYKYSYKPLPGVVALLHAICS